MLIKMDLKIKTEIKMEMDIWKQKKQNADNCGCDLTLTGIERA
jgi:hypothetical protein